MYIIKNIVFSSRIQGVWNLYQTRERAIIESILYVQYKALKRQARFSRTLLLHGCREPCRDNLFRTLQAFFSENQCSHGESQRILAIYTSENTGYYTFQPIFFYRLMPAGKNLLMQMFELNSSQNTVCARWMEVTTVWINIRMFRSLIISYLTCFKRTEENVPLCKISFYPGFHLSRVSLIQGSTYPGFNLFQGSTYPGLNLSRVSLIQVSTFPRFNLSRVSLIQSSTYPGFHLSKVSFNQGSTYTGFHLL